MLADLRFQRSATNTQNAQNSPEPSKELNSVYCVHNSLPVEDFIRELRSLDVILSVEGDRLAFDAPGDVLSEELLGKMRANRELIIKALMSESIPASSVIVCPWCQSGDLIDYGAGVRCRRCWQLAWIETANGTLVRADCCDGLVFLRPEGMRASTSGAKSCSWPAPDS